MRELVKQERSHGQWAKQGINLICLTFLLLQSLFRGGKGSIGFERCSNADWIFLTLFVIVMVSIVVLAVKYVAK